MNIPISSLLAGQKFTIDVELFQVPKPMGLSFRSISGAFVFASARVAYPLTINHLIHKAKRLVSLYHIGKRNERTTSHCSQDKSSPSTLNCS